MEGALVVFAVLLVLLGFLNVSEATLGVALIASGGVLGIFARLVQARSHHKEVMSALRGEDDSIDDFSKEVMRVRAENQAE